LCRPPVARGGGFGRAYAGTVKVLVVDAANVVGSQPNGWWRDRPGAARRLHERVESSSLAFDEVVLVLEGAARRGQPEGRTGRLRTIHAAGSGDDAIVDLVRSYGDDDSITLVTADRELRARVETAGAATVGPGWLLDRL
jgi:hypothetical protein